MQTVQIGGNVAPKPRAVSANRIRLLVEQYQAQHKLSQEDIAKQMGMSHSQMWRYLSGASEPSPAIILRIAEFFDVSVDYLFDRTDNPYMPKSDKLSSNERDLIEAVRKHGVTTVLTMLARFYENRGEGGESDD